MLEALNATQAGGAVGAASKHSAQLTAARFSNETEAFFGHVGARGDFSDLMFDNDGEFDSNQD